MSNFNVFLYVAFLLLAAIASLIPDLLSMGFHTDKMMHVTFVCLALIWPCLNFKHIRNIFFIAFAILFCGIIIELLQALTPNRKTEWGDIAANMVGIITGLIIGFLMRTGYYADITNIHK